MCPSRYQGVAPATGHCADGVCSVVLENELLQHCHQVSDDTGSCFGNGINNAFVSFT